MPLDIGRIGVWTFTLDLQPMGRSQEAVGEPMRQWRDLAGALGLAG